MGTLITNHLFRMKSHRTHRPRVQHLFPSSLEATKQLCRSLQARMITGPCTFLLAMFTITSGVHTVMPLFYWHSYLFQKVHLSSIISLAPTNLPQAAKKCSDDVSFRKFKKQIFHTALARILRPLKHGMTTPEVLRCPDGHFRRAIYGIGPYIADYPEQVLLACIVQNWCGR